MFILVFKDSERVIESTVCRIWIQVGKIFLPDLDKNLNYFNLDPNTSVSLCFNYLCIIVHLVTVFPIILCSTYICCKMVYLVTVFPISLRCTNIEQCTIVYLVIVQCTAFCIHCGVPLFVSYYGVTILYSITW